MKYKLLVPFGLHKAGDILETNSRGCSGYKTHEYSTVSLFPHDILIMLKLNLLEEADKKWEPKNDDVVFLMYGDGKIAKDFYSEGKKDYFTFGLCFPTEAEAIKAREAIKRLLADMRK